MAYLQDKQLIEAVNNYMASNKNVTLQDIRRNCKTTSPRLKALQRAGLLKLPTPMSKKQAGIIGRSKSDARGQRFVINSSKPQVWQI